MTAWSFCPTQIQEALTHINLKNKGDLNDLNIYRDIWLSWSKDFYGKEKYTQWAICNGIHDAIVNQIVYKSKEYEDFYTFESDYLFYDTLLKPYRHHKISPDRIGSIEPNSYVIVSQPNHEGGITSWFKDLKDYCRDNNVKIFLDCAFFGTTQDTLDVYDEVFDCVAFSLSKSFMLGGFRAGIVFGNDLSDTLTIPISEIFSYTYYNSCAVQLAKVIMPNFTARYITDVAKPIQIEYCTKNKIHPCDIWMMGRRGKERFNLVDDLQSQIQRKLNELDT